MTYETGHGFAIQYAAGTNSNLSLAYAINAFADHYLQDSFSAGHVRTPRRLLHGLSVDSDLCCKVQFTP